MLVNFYFNSPAKAKSSGTPYNIYIDFRYSGKRFKYPTGMKLKYPHFRQSKNMDQMVTTQYENDTGQKRIIVVNEFKELIKRIEEVIYAHKDGKIQDHALSEAFENAVKNKLVMESNLLEYFDKFTDEKKMTGIAKNTIKVIGSTRTVYEGIIEQNPKMPFDVFNLDVEFFNAMRKYCISKGHQAATYNKYLKWTKSLMHWLTKRYSGAKINKYYMEETNAETTEKVVAYILDEEIKALWEFKFKDPAHDAQRDMFIWQYLSGQRHDEMESLKIGFSSIDEKNMIWHASSGKTYTVQDIPISPIMLQIFNKYKEKGKFPLTELQVRNRVLKNIFKIVGLDRNIITREFKLGDNKPTFTNVPLYDVVTTHLARSSKVTSMSNSNFSDNMMRQITGHTNSKMLQRYMGSNIEELRKKIVEAENQLFGTKPKGSN